MSSRFRLGLLCGLSASKQVDKSLHLVGSSDWDMTLEAVNIGRGSWWLLGRGRKAVASVGSLARWSFLLPFMLGAPPHALGPEGAVFSGPRPPGSTRALAVGLCVTKGVFVSRGVGHLCCAHTSSHGVQDLLFSPSLSCPCAWRLHADVPRPKALHLLPSLAAAAETWSLGGPPVFPSLLYQRRLR